MLKQRMSLSDFVSEAKKRGRARYDELAPPLRLEGKTEWTLVFSLDPNHSDYVAAEYPREAQKMAETHFGPTARLYMRGLGLDSLPTEVIVIPL